MEKFVVERENVCAGILCRKATDVYAKTKDRLISPYRYMDLGNTNAYTGHSCRSMMFYINENGLTQDLRYTTPKHYPIRGVENKIDVESRFYVDGLVQLGELLKHLEFPELMNQDDLNKAHGILIASKRWLNKNIELFGLYEQNGEVVRNSDSMIFPNYWYGRLLDISDQKSKPHAEEPGTIYGLIKKIK